jgi:hypothetical protein
MIMKNVFGSKFLLMASLAMLLPAAASASIVNISLIGLTGTNTESIGNATINFQDISINSNFIVDMITEVYSYNSGTNVATITLTSTATNATYGFVAGATFLTIKETGNTLTTTAATTQQYANISSLTFSSAFATANGFTYTTTNGSPAVGAPSYSNPDLSATYSGGTVSSATGNLNLVTSTPEPATFGMLGLALIAGAGYGKRKFRSKSRK